MTLEEETIADQRFDLESGALCLDFANTVDWHASDNPQDQLDDYDDLLSWGVAAGVVGGRQAEGLRQWATANPKQAAQALERAVALREAIYRLFVAHAQQQSPAAADLDLLNEAAREARWQQRLRPTKDGFAWRWVEEDVGPERIGRAVAVSAAKLLTSDGLDRVRQCADDRGCGYLFVDASRNRSRRWCSMEACGNRAKVRRHYRRQQAEEA